MGGGNGEKPKMAREKKMEKQKGAKGSQLVSNKKGTTIKVSTTSRTTLEVNYGETSTCIRTRTSTKLEVKCRQTSIRKK